MKVLFLHSGDFGNIDEAPHNHLSRRPVIDCGLPVEPIDMMFHDVGPDGEVTVLDEQVVELVESIRPEIVVYNQPAYGRHLAPATFERMRGLGARIVTNVYDNTIIKDHQTPALLDVSDVFVVYDSLQSWLEYRLASEFLLGGRTRVVYGGGYFSLSAVPRERPHRAEHDVVFIGTVEGSRQEFFERLDRLLSPRGIRIGFFGGLVARPGRAPGPARGHLALADYFSLMARSRIVLNCQSINARQQIKGRIYETLAAGSLCLTDRTPDVEAMFPADALVRYGSAEECAAAISALLADEPARRRIAENGHSWFRATIDAHAYWAGVLHAAGDPTAPVPQPAALDETLMHVRRLLPMLSPQLMDVIRLARTLSISGLDRKEKLPFLTVATLESVPEDIRGRIDNTLMGFTYFKGPERRAMVLSGWGMVLE
jgi:hypothetical protein